MWQCAIDWIPLWLISQRYVPNRHDTCTVFLSADILCFTKNIRKSWSLRLVHNKCFKIHDHLNVVYSPHVFIQYCNKSGMNVIYSIESDIPLGYGESRSPSSFWLLLLFVKPTKATLNSESLVAQTSTEDHWNDHGRLIQLYIVRRCVWSDHSKHLLICFL